MHSENSRVRTSSYLLPAELGQLFEGKTLDVRPTGANAGPATACCVTLSMQLHFSGSPLLQLLTEDNHDSSPVGCWEEEQVQVCLEGGTWSHPDLSSSLPISASLAFPKVSPVWHPGNAW